MPWGFVRHQMKAWAGKSYRKPGMNLKGYTKIMLAPLVIWPSPDSRYEGMEPLTMWWLALRFQLLDTVGTIEISADTLRTPSVIPAVGGGYPSFFRFTRGFRRVSLPPTHSSSSQVVSGDPSEKSQDGFPIKNVGNDGDGHGLPINIVGIDEEERFPFIRERRGGSSSILKTQQVRHSSNIV